MYIYVCIYIYVYIYVYRHIYHTSIIQGRWKSVDGDIYEGKFAQGVRQGIGKYTAAHGEIYEGEFLENLPHGHGVYFSSNGDIYEVFFFKGDISPNGHNLYSLMLIIGCLTVTEYIIRQSVIVRGIFFGFFLGKYFSQRSQIV